MSLCVTRSHNPLLWCETSAKGYALYREKRGSRSATNCPVEAKAISCSVIDNQMDTIIEELALEPSWREKIIAKMSAISEHDRILKERKLTSDKLRRLVKAYVDGLVEEGKYNLQRKLLQDNLETLVVPEVDDATKAGELIENLGKIWGNATLEKKHKLLTVNLDAVYVDLLTNRNILGLRPKPVFYQFLNPSNENQTQR